MNEFSSGAGDLDLGASMLTKLWTDVVHRRLCHPAPSAPSDAVDRPMNQLCRLMYAAGVQAVKAGPSWLRRRLLLKPLCRRSNDRASASPPPSTHRQALPHEHLAPPQTSWRPPR